jgi:hypothetical protein
MMHFLATIIPPEDMADIFSESSDESTDDSGSDSSFDDATEWNTDDEEKIEAIMATWW